MSLVYAEPLRQRRQRLERRLDRLGAVADDERADRGAADHQQLDRLEQRAEVAAGEGEAAEDRRTDDDVTDDDQHG